MSNLFNPGKYVSLDLTDSNGNAFAVMANFQRAAKREGWKSEEIDKVLTEAKSGDYSHLLGTILDHCK